jgi:propionyl-CoA synthetase
MYRWFPDAELNTCYNALDRHVERGRAEQVALIYDSPVTDQVVRYTYRELRDQVAKVAGALRDLGVEKGDRVVVYMPMMPEAVMTMLACARLGAVHSVVFGGFAAAELATRISDAQPGVVSASCGIEVTGSSRTAAAGPGHRPGRPQAGLLPDRAASAGGAALALGRDVDWDVACPRPIRWTACRSAPPTRSCSASARPEAEGVVDNGGHAVALHWSMTSVYGMDPGEVWWTASDVGWVVGHSYIVTGRCSRLHHGPVRGKPVGTGRGAFWRVIAEHGVRVLFTAPTAFRAIRKGPDRRAPGQARPVPAGGAVPGRRAARPGDLPVASDLLGIPVVDLVADRDRLAGRGQPARAGRCRPSGSLTVPMPGWDVRVLDPSGAPAPADVDGALVMAAAAAGALPTLWRDDERYVSSYLSRRVLPVRRRRARTATATCSSWAGRRRDQRRRALAVHRAMEEVLAGHLAVAECAVIGVADELKVRCRAGSWCSRPGSRPIPRWSPGWCSGCGPRSARWRRCAGSTWSRRCQTRSGKILRGSMRAIADGVEQPVPSTIEDPAVLDAPARPGRSRRPLRLAGRRLDAACIHRESRDTL